MKKTNKNSCFFNKIVNKYDDDSIPEPKNNLYNNPLCNQSQTNCFKLPKKNVPDIESKKDEIDRFDEI